MNAAAKVKKLQRSLKPTLGEEVRGILKQYRSTQHERCNSILRSSTAAQ